MLAGGKMRRIDGRGYKGYAHWCPGCDEMHVFAVEGVNASGASWAFDGDLDRPTFFPSMWIRVNAPDQAGHDPEEPTIVCHYFLQKGVIRFLADCTHGLKDQRVELPPLPEHLRDKG